MKKQKADLLTEDQKDYIQQHYRVMFANQMALNQKTSVFRVREYMIANHLTLKASWRNRHKVDQRKKVPEGCFDYTERENWMI